jgi:hypothetical protein
MTFEFSRVHTSPYNVLTKPLFNFSRNCPTTKQRAGNHSLASAAVVQGQQHSLVARTRSEMGGAQELV